MISKIIKKKRFNWYDQITLIKNYLSSNVDNKELFNFDANIESGLLPSHIIYLFVWEHSCICLILKQNSYLNDLPET